ncbi:MAG: class I SAM-dependent methyltransferase [Pseudonocardia sp.]
MADQVQVGERPGNSAPRPDHYAGAANGWANGAAHVHGPLAVDLVDAVPHPLDGRLALDAGAGTDLVSACYRPAEHGGGAGDLSADMLCWRAAQRPPAVVGELGRLPLRTASVDDALAAFVLNHLPAPLPALRELGRVTPKCPSGRLRMPGSNVARITSRSCVRGPRTATQRRRRRRSASQHGQAWAHRLD